VKSFDAMIDLMTIIPIVFMPIREKTRAHLTIIQCFNIAQLLRAVRVTSLLIKDYDELVKQ